MATVENVHGEKRPSSEGSLPKLGRTQNGKEAAGYSLDERRRAALAEIDNAKFSYVLLRFNLFEPVVFMPFFCSLVGSMPKSVWSPVSVSSLMVCIVYFAPIISF